ncbi:Low affinity vacuolar monovalent cation/H(+) antiporter [Lamellibrachia satsuma]|nr:Low affinity vacuolar monovalent cation/H(+) antiporter [Lamellibrachia satsuma]
MTSYKPHKTSVMAESDGASNALVVEVEDNVGKIGLEDITMGDEVRSHASSVPDRAHDPQPLRRRRGNSQQSGSTSPQPRLSLCSGNFDTATVLQYDVITKPENELEVQRMVNNHMFGFRKWKSHISKRPLSGRSDIVKELYANSERITSEDVSNISTGNLLYVLLFGWWIAAVYLLVAIVMAVTIIGWRYSAFCWKLACYFIWPFGKFLYKNSPTELRVVPDHCGTRTHDLSSSCADETSPLHSSSQPSSETECLRQWSGFWKRPQSYMWLILGMPTVCLIHALAFFLSWLTVIFIPVAKVNLKAIKNVLLMPPELLMVSRSSLDSEMTHSDIVLYTYQAMNLYYYKYSVDGLSVIPLNLFVVVVAALCLEYFDKDGNYATKGTKFTLSLIAIIPLAYYIAMVISSISAQSNFAVGAVLNASFGSIVELILYETALVKDVAMQTLCYNHLVKSALIGTLLATTMLIPGLAMVIGGLKHQTQRFNPQSVGVSATLMFVSVTAVFAPTIFSRAHSSLTCHRCDNVTRNSTDNSTWGLSCRDCTYEMFEEGSELYRNHVMPVVYTCVIILPLSYIIGLIYSLKTHKSLIYDKFLSEVNHHHPSSVAHWGLIKGILILAVSVVLMGLCADALTNNITPMLSGSGMTVYFIGVTLLAVIPEIPEIVIGIQFALQNNISLSIEVGMCVAVQVCMVQIPLLVFANLIYPVGFYLLFSDIHLFSIIIGVLMMNYVFQDGKSDYFQGSALMMSYLALISMYFFAPQPANLKC